MNSTRAVAKNTFLLTVGLVLGRILGLLVIKKMTPILGTDGMGIWAWATDLTVIALIISNYGLDTLVTREVSRAHGMTLPIMWAALRVRWLMALFCYLFLLGYVYLTDKEALPRAAMLVTALTVFVESSAMACDAILQAHDKVQYQMTGQLTSSVVYFGLAYWSLDAGYGLMGVVWSNLISRVVRLLVMLPLMLTKTGPWRRRPDEGTEARDFPWMMRLGFPVFLSTAFGIVMFKIDIAMLTEMVGQTATGIYFLGHRALDYLYLIPHLFATALFPSLARLATDDLSDTGRMGEKALRYMMIVALPLTLLTIFVAGPIIRWFDARSEFTASIPVVRIVTLGMPFLSAHLILNRVLLAAGQEKSFVTIALVSMLANVSLNLVLIPHFSYIGAGAASVFSLAVGSWMHLYFVRRAGLRLPLLRALGGSTLALALAWSGTVVTLRTLAPRWGIDWLVLPVDAGWAPFLGTSALWAIFFAGAVFALRVLDREDLDLLRQLLK